LAGTILAPNAESLTPTSCLKQVARPKSIPTLCWASVHECALTEALAGRADAMLQLAVVLSLVVVTQRLNDEPVSVDRPVLET
jgi:hypothetical protein